MLARDWHAVAVAGRSIVFAGGAPAGTLWPSTVLNAVDIFT